MTSWIFFGDPSTNTDGSKSGYEAIASTSPVFGSRATPAAPVESPCSETCSASASCSARWVGASIVSCTSLARPRRLRRDDVAARGLAGGVDLARVAARGAAQVALVLLLDPALADGLVALVAAVAVRVELLGGDLPGAAQRPGRPAGPRGTCAGSCRAAARRGTGARAGRRSTPAPAGCSGRSTTDSNGRLSPASTFSASSCSVTPSSLPARRVSTCSRRSPVSSRGSTTRSVPVRLLTSSWPLRSRTLPRGASVTTVRRRLPSAAAAYCSPLMTWRNQSRTSSRPRSVRAMPPSTAMRTAVLGVRAGAQPPAEEPARRPVRRGGRARVLTPSPSRAPPPAAARSGAGRSAAPAGSAAP